MDISENERLQELFLVVGDRVSEVRSVWWYILLVALILTIPGYFFMKASFVTALLHGYSGPKMIYTAPVKEPLQIIDKKIFSLPDNTYSGFVRIKNINLEWGVADQVYTVEFRTFGGTVVNSFNRTTFILPASEKLLALPRFVSDKKPDELVVTLGETKFLHKPTTEMNFEIQRTTLTNNPTGMIVTSAFINQSPFTVARVDLTESVYNSQNQIVAVNATNINDVKSSETRTFQATWPAAVAGAVRAEVIAEVNIFDRTILSTPEGVGEFSQ